MSYEPTTWKAGDTVTSAKLNKIEQGIAGNVKIFETIFVEDPNDRYNKYFETVETATEIKTAFLNGTTVILHIPFNDRAKEYSFAKEENHVMTGYTIDDLDVESFIFSSLSDSDLYRPTIQDDKLQFAIYVD